MTNHDPKQVFEDVRSHLAAHDRRLTFLFGAGTSSAVNIAPAPCAGEKPKHESLIPGIDGLTEICGTAVGAMGDTQAAAWKTLAMFSVNYLFPLATIRIPGLGGRE